MNEKKNCSIEVWSRVTGFFRPVGDYNKGKAEEYAERKTYDPEKTEVRLQEEFK